MNQIWLPLERNEPDLHLWSLNVIALIHTKNEKAMQFWGGLLGRHLDSYMPNYVQK